MGLSRRQFTNEFKLAGIRRLELANHLLWNSISSPASTDDNRPDRIAKGNVDTRKRTCSTGLISAPFRRQHFREPMA
jgi:hypothetical protein